MLHPSFYVCDNHFYYSVFFRSFSLILLSRQYHNGSFRRNRSALIAFAVMFDTYVFGARVNCVQLSVKQFLELVAKAVVPVARNIMKSMELNVSLRKAKLNDLSS